MRKRHDYRNAFSGMNEEELKFSLTYHKDQLLRWIGIDDEQSELELKRVSYIEGKLNSK